MTRHTITANSLTLHNLLPPASCRAHTQSAEPITDTSPVPITDATSPSLATSSPLSSLPDDTPPAKRDLPPHQSIQHCAVAYCWMSKPVDFPKLTEELTPVAIDSWLSRCEDMYEAWLAMNPEKSLAPKVRIMLAGLHMEQKATATWWNENRTALKELVTWAAFAEKLENTRNTLTSARKGYSIPDSIFKNHLLFHCHPLLCLRVSGQPGFAYENLQVDGLIGNMMTSWLSLVAECVIRVSTTASAPTSSLPSVLSLSLPVATSTPAAPAPFIHSLIQAEKDTLRAAGSCYHCKKTPQYPGWVKHRSKNCPGDSALGIPPHAATSVVAVIGAPGFSSSLYDECRTTAVAVVMPAPDFEDPNDSLDDIFSAGTDDSYLSTLSPFPLRDLSLILLLLSANPFDSRGWSVGGADDCCGPCDLETTLSPPLRPVASGSSAVSYLLASNNLQIRAQSLKIQQKNKPAIDARTRPPNCSMHRILSYIKPRWNTEITVDVQTRRESGDTRKER
ncbi:hypothetical protein DFH08DRAFT_806904 [Mycena albidolilacea]|uniref:Uncharacterized protein n=1 Tax=Mycena albidolilacea TaxID=1033008 RepID=A0AAD7ETI8_9AGAR|nr:hypothetical protein DFH08DRAFT_806904 [Mycena albidolilacea]